jgi:hypothetical protein
MSMLEKVTRFLARPESQLEPAPAPVVSHVVIVHDMVRQAENTLRSMFSDYQRGIQPHQYEVIIVENESPNLMRREFISALPGNFRYYLRRNAEPSPGPAINFGVSKARGDNICIQIDGARMLTPGVMKNIILGHEISESAVVSIPGYHLGHELQQEAVASGYDSASERRLLESINWPEEGYRLFEISCLNASSALGFFLPNSESNCISLPRRIWDELGGYDPRFDLRGGGLVNLDFYKRACEHPGVRHIILPGEGTFHQFHGGVTTGGQDMAARDAYIGASNAQYRELRGCEYENPRTTPIFLGEIREQVQRFVLYSAKIAMESDGSECMGTPY